jgi:hypothetical protein
MRQRPGQIEKMRVRPGPAAVHGQEHRERNRTHRVGFLSRGGHGIRS